MQVRTCMHSEWDQGRKRGYCMDVVALIPGSGSKQQSPLIPSLYSQISVL